MQQAVQGSTLERNLTVSVPVEEIEAEITSRLKQLARTVKMQGFRPGHVPLKMVERHYGPQVRQEVLSDRVQKQFFESSFHGEGELRFVVHASLSKHSNALLQQRMRKLAEEFDALAEEDGRSVDRRGQSGTTMVVAIRPWELAVFSELRRPAR
jgi:hypothetical protein